MILARDEYWDQWDEGKFAFHICKHRFIQSTILNAFFYQIERALKEIALDKNAPKKGEEEGVLLEVELVKNGRSKRINLHLYKWGTLEEGDFREIWNGEFR